MVEITNNTNFQTVMLTYEVPLGAYDQLLELLTNSYDQFLSLQSGFVGAAIHANEAKTRIASYSQWENKESFMAVLRTDRMQKVNRQLGDLSKGFEPVLYDVTSVFGK